MMHLPVPAQEQRGFTLVETLVAIAIIMIAIVGPYYSIQQAITTSFVARDQLIASQLSQEGEEYIYFLRDTNYLKSAPWLTGLDACFSSYGCTVDPYVNRIAQCTTAACAPLMLNNSNQYTQTGNYPQTKFTRIIKMATISANQVQVTVTVSWETVHRTYTVNTVENLYNWL